MRTAAAVLAVLLAVAFGWGLLNARNDLREAEARAAVLSEERAQAEQQALEAAERAQAAGRRADSLNAVTVRLREAAAARERAERLRADSLQTEIANLVPPGEARERLEAALAEFRESFEVRLAGKDRIIQSQADEIGVLREQVAESEAARVALAVALDRSKAEVEVWRKAAHPGIVERLRRDAGLIGGAGAIIGGLLLFLAH